MPSEHVMDKIKNSRLTDALDKAAMRLASIQSMTPVATMSNRYHPLDL